MKRAWLLVLALAACATPNPAGIYSGYAALPGDESQEVRVSLLPGDRAEVLARYSNRPDAAFAEGNWQRLADGRVAVDLRDEHLVFRVRGDQLIGEEWDRRKWGEKGPGVLYRVP